VIGPVVTGTRGGTQGPTHRRRHKSKGLTQSVDPVLLWSMIEGVPFEILLVSTLGLACRQRDEDRRHVGRAGRQHGRQLIGRSSWERSDRHDSTGGRTRRRLEAGELSVWRLIPVASGMLDDRDHFGGHETSCPNRDAGPRDLGHLDRTADVRHFDATAGTAGVDLESLHAGADVDQDLDAVAFHLFQASHTGPDRLSANRDVLTGIIGGPERIDRRRCIDRNG
jgi:hypothetical protein